MARLKQVRRGRLLFDVRDDGPVDGETVVLLHGFPQTSASFLPVVPELHGHGLRTLAPDQRGYSPGARPPRRGDYRLEFLVADVLALLDAAGLRRAHLVGHDWGGGVAWATAAAHPGRVASLTVLSTPHLRAAVRALGRSDQAMRSWYIAAFQLPRLPESVLPARLPDLLLDSGLPRTSAERDIAALSAPGALTAALNWYRALPLSRMSVGDVTVPTTYVWGSRDFALGRTAAELTGDHVTGPYRFIELPAGHWLPEREPEEVAAAILDRVAES